MSSAYQYVFRMMLNDAAAGVSNFESQRNESTDRAVGGWRMAQVTMQILPLKNLRSPAGTHTVPQKCQPWPSRSAPCALRPALPLGPRRFCPLGRTAGMQASISNAFRFTKTTPTWYSSLLVVVARAKESPDFDALLNTFAEKVNVVSCYRYSNYCLG